MTYILSDDDLAFVGVRRQKIRPANAPIILDPDDPANADRFSISKHWVSITTGPNNQDVTCLINGIKGSGKSNFMLAEGWRCAERTAEILGGHPSDYFCIDNVCIMDPDLIFDVLTKPEKNQVIGLDDTGTINGARAFRTDLNQWVNNILITNRPQHNITLMTTPDQGHVDKQAREIGNYYIEMVPHPALRSRGYGLLKFFRREKNYRTGKTLWKYLHWNDAKIVRCICPRAPKWLEEEYDKKRELSMRKVWTRVSEDKGCIVDITSPQERRPTKSQIAAKVRAESAQKAYDELAATTGLSHTEILKEIGVKKRTWYNWVDDGYITPLVPRPPLEPHPPKNQIAAKARAETAQKAYGELAATTGLSHIEILKEIGVKKQTWYNWMNKGYITK